MYIQPCVHDVHFPRIAEMYFDITNYDTATAGDHTGLSVAVSSGVFAPWFILFCRVASKLSIFLRAYAIIKYVLP